MKNSDDVTQLIERIRTDIDEPYESDIEKLLDFAEAASDYIDMLEGGKSGMEQNFWEDYT